jgi:amino acid adenylation domain-containing protein
MDRPRVEDIYPLSPTQQGMLFHTLHAPDSGVYFEQLTCELTGDLDGGAFERSWRRVVARHPALRTAFDWESMDEPVQVVLGDPPLPFEHLDWSGLDAGEQRRRLQQTLAADRGRGFDLAVAPLVRLALIRLGERRFRFLWSHHHLILDGWSMPLLFHELFRLYEAEIAGRPAALPPPPRPYRDYIAWLKRQDAAAAEAFWRRELAGFTAPTPLACGRPMPAAAAAAVGARAPYEERELRLSTAETAALQELAQRYRVTLNSLVQACWAILLHRHSGDLDVTFGVVVSGRPPQLAGVEAMVGLFLATLPLRLEVSPAAELPAFVRGVQEKLAAVQAFEFSPLVDVQTWSEVPRGLPLFESLVIFQNYPVETAAGGPGGPRGPGNAGDPGNHRGDALRIGDSRVVEHTNYPLNLSAHPGPELGLGLSYDSGRFDAATMEEVLRQLRGLLLQAVEQPAAAVGSLSLITAAARQWLPDPTIALPASPHDSLPARFRAVAARQPQAPAVLQGERVWTYGELAAAAAAVAHRLLAAGAAAADVIAVRGQPGAPAFGMVSGALGVLLAGGALLLIDRRLPAERQRAMLELAGARLLVQVGEPDGGPDLPAEIEPLPPLRVIQVDADTGWPAKIAAPASLAAPTATAAPAEPAATAELTEHAPPAELAEPAPGAAAYVFFTSGTTGEPKAVLGCHRGLAHFLDWQRACFAVGPGDRVAQVTALSFDVVLRELFLPLTSGAALCLRPPGLEAASPEVPAWLAEAGITLLHTVPSLALSWTAAEPGSVGLDRLRCVFFAGEPLGDELVRRWRETFAYRGEVINLYGPTETTLAKCWYRVPAAPRPGVQPIGEALPEAQALILAAGGRRCGLLEPGEIVLRTPFRTLGYLAPESGQEPRFAPNPFRDDATDLVYHSGDVGRLGADGLLEILGRRDRQMKIRGVRVEPAEIERVLRRHAGVRDVAVVAIADPRGNRLAAYVVPHAAAAATLAAEALARLAREALPEPLVPSHFVFLSELPLTPHGKLDRDALPAPEAAGAPGGARRVAPRDWIELAVAAIWEELLGAAVPGVTESFFALGGHSLLVAPLLARIERRFQQKIPLAVFLPAPTVEQLAVALRSRAAALPRSPLLPIRPQGSGAPLFFVHPLAGNALCYVALAQSLARHLPDQPFYGLDAQFTTDSGPSFTSLEDMARTYVAAVRQAWPDGPYHLGGWSFGGLLAFEMARQLAAQGADVQLVALLDTHLPAARQAGAAPAEVDDATIIVELLGPDLDLAEEELRRLTPEAQRRHLVDLARRAQALPPGLDEAAIQAMMAIVHRHGRLVHSYQPRPYPGRLTFFRAALDRPHDSNLERWQALTRETLEVIPLAASHRDMVSPPQVEALAEELARRVAAVAAR